MLESAYANFFKGLWSIIMKIAAVLLSYAGATSLQCVQETLLNAVNTRTHRAMPLMNILHMVAAL